MSSVYYFENGLRKVKPYTLTRHITSKRRWVGRSVQQVFDREINPNHQNDPATIKLQVLRKKNTKRGRLTDELIQGKKVYDILVEDGDIITYTLHVHEPPVLLANETKVVAGGKKPGLEILQDDEDCLVINKPAGVPVHPTGKYNRNSLVSILALEHGYTFAANETKQNVSGGGGMLAPTHRLDRVTSGVLILAKTRAYARRIQAELEHRTGVSKEYLALVSVNTATSGQLTAGQNLTCNTPLFETQFTAGFDRFASRLGAVDSFNAGPKQGKSGGGGGGPKPAETRVSVLWAHGSRALVSCTPVTGRTHQIRKHLAILGLPIANDPVYGDRIIGPLFINLSDRVNALHEQAVREATANKNQQNVKIDYVETVRELFTEIELVMREKGAAAANHGKTDFEDFHTCSECGVDLDRYKDPAPEDLFIYLHALKYSGPSFSYKTSLPGWARAYID